MISIIKNFLSPYLAYIKIGVAIVILGVVSYFCINYLVMKHEITALEAEKTLAVNNLKIATDSNKILESNTNRCYASNAENIKTIDELTKSRQDTIKQLELLQSQKTAAQTKVTDLKKQVADLAKDKKNDGEISTVLSETLKSLRAGETK